jgi:membrane protease YdiL (CAAX protease family)
MISTFFRESSPAMKITLTLLFCLTGMLFFMLIGSIVIFSIYGSTALSYLSNPNPSIPEALAVLKILQICQGIGMFIVPGFLLAMYFSSNPLRYLGFNRINVNLGLLAILTILVAYPAINLLASLNEQVSMPQWMTDMEQKAQVLTKAFMSVDSFWGVLLNIFMIAVLPALGEELIFRGLLQKIFTELTGKVVWGIIISAALFSGMHLQFQGFIPRLALGILFGFFYLWSGSLWLPIIAHFINNSVAIIGYSLIYKGSIPAEAENVGGLSVMWPLGLLSLGLVLILLWRIKSEGLRISKVE